jgi:hypothetical protein
MKFVEWFEKQHGQRLIYKSPPFLAADDNELRHMCDIGNMAKLELERRVLYDRRWDSALWAWQATTEVITRD